MNKLFLTLGLFWVLIGSASSKESKYSLDEPNKIIINNTMNELIEIGYELVNQETRGIITVYVLKKEGNFVGCRLERSIKKEIEKCYEIELVNSISK